MHNASISPSFPNSSTSLINMLNTASGILALAALPYAFGAMIQVQVGAGGNLAFDPPFVNANPGDVIDFILCVVHVRCVT